LSIVATKSAGSIDGVGLSVTALAAGVDGAGSLAATDGAAELGPGATDGAGAAGPGANDGGTLVDPQPARVRTTTAARRDFTASASGS